MIQHNESSRFFEQIIRMTGMSSSEIQADLVEKMEILSWLVDNKIRSLKSIGKVMNSYYSNKELLMGAIKKNDRKFLSDEI